MLTGTAAYPSADQIQAYVAEAHRLRAVAFAGFVLRLFRRSGAATETAPAGRLASA